MKRMIVLFALSAVSIPALAEPSLQEVEEHICRSFEEMAYEITKRRFEGETLPEALSYVDQPDAIRLVMEAYQLEKPEGILEQIEVGEAFAEEIYHRCFREYL